MHIKELFKRTISAALALIMVSNLDISVSYTKKTLNANAAGEQTNAALALGLKNDAPEGFDEDDNLKNPYGRKTVTFGEADEALIYDKTGGYRLFGHDTAPDTKITLNTSKTEQYKWTEAKAAPDLSGFSKTVAGNFDGNTEGKTNQYLEIKYAQSSLSEANTIISVHDAKSQKTEGEISFAFADEYFADEDPYDLASAGIIITSEDKKYIASQLSAAVGDFDGNGRDEIAVLTNSKTGNQIEHYTGDITMESLPNENCIDKDGNYVLVEKEPSSSKIIGKALVKSWNDGCIRLLLDNADINSDIYDMTVEDFKTSVSPSDVYFFFYMGYPIVYDMYMFGFENAENEYEMPMRCYHSDSGKGSSVNIYAFTDNSKDFLDINQWELKRTFSVNNCESVSLAAGDLNNDGIDDLVIGESNVLDGKKAIPASVKVYSGGYLDMLTECTVIDSEFSKYGVTVFENNSSSKMRTYLAVLASDDKDGKITAYHFDGENYEETGSVAVTIDFNEKLNANEIYYANGYLMSPIIKSCVKFSANGLTSADYGSYNIGNALSSNDEFAFDFQTADLNGNGQQTVFYQTVSYNGYQSRIYTHSFGASEDIHFNDRNAGNLYALVNTDNDSFYMTYTGKHWFEYENTRDTGFFNVFRVSDINGRQAKVLVAAVPSSAGLLNSDGLFTYTLEDEGQNANGGRTVMIPGMQYEYQIIAARDPSKPPCTSMPSEIIYAYTHVDNIYPDITLKGVTNNKLTIYPDREYNISAEINNEDDYIYIVCQWQKKGKTGWADVIGETSDTLTIEEPDADAAGKYRCRVDALAYNEEMNSQVGVTVFTDDIDVTFKMRSVKQDAFDVKCESKKPEAVFTISSASSACRIAPTGTVSFKVKGSLFEKTYSVPLKTSGKQSTAKLSEAADLSDLADGVYQVTASYGGDSIYGSFRSEAKKIIAGESAVYPVLLNENGESVDTLYYGDIISLKFYRYIRNADGTVSEEYYKHSDEMNNVSFKNQIRTYSIPFEIEGKQTVLNFTLKSVLLK